jgi:hypothetical protein
VLGVLLAEAVVAGLLSMGLILVLAALVAVVFAVSILGKVKI